ncbi:MAG: response regulator [Saprospiraceae bacterium]|nr:response regulator [Candidatus Vicinibacter affinis]
MNIFGKDRFVSLAVKNAVVYILLILLSSSLIGFFLYRISSNIVISSSEQQLSHTVEILDVKINSYINNIRKDILFLSRSAFLKDYIKSMYQSGVPLMRNKLGEDYISFMSSRPDYAQLRIIGKENAGQEIIRVDQFEKGIHLVQRDQLQQKGFSSYFQETLTYPEDSVYFSVIDLNKEHGKISNPQMSTLRVACPIFIQDTTFGIIIINANLNAFLDELKKTVPKEFELYLMNHQGYYLTHPDPAKEFGFEHNLQPAGFVDLKIDIKNLQSDQLKIYSSATEKNLLAYKKINYPRKDYFLILGLQASRETLLVPFYRWQGSILLITLFIVLAVVFLALWWLRKQTLSLESITKSMTSFGQNLSTEKLPIHQNDEIGMLARSFSSMSQTIQQNIHTLAKARDEAEEANRQKEEFLQNMSHEIRNPLHTIIGMSRMLAENNPKSEQLPLIESLKFSSDNLLALVNDVLDYSKLKEGQITLQSEPIQLDQLLQQIHKAYLFEARTKKIELELILDKTIEGKVFKTDGLRLSQIINNLLSNALKFTHAGGKITLKVKGSQVQDGQFKLFFEVSDTGIGIRADQISLIHQRFQKMDSGQGISNIHGVGLGLPIVVQMLDLFGSKLEIKSELSKGSDFSFAMELKVLDQKSNVSKSSLPVSIDDRYRNILVIDDDPQIQLLYKHIFDKPGIKYVQLHHPDDLRELSPGLLFELILTDYNFDDYKIVDHLSELRKFKAEGGAIVCVTGAHDISRVSTEGEEIFDAVIQKPVSPQKLIQRVNELAALQTYPAPDVEVLYRDYDFQKDKVLRALEILIAEWQDAMSGFKTAVDQHDAGLRDRILHKLVNSLRRFSLFDLEQLIHGLPIETSSEELDEQWKLVQMKMEFYLNYFVRERLKFQKD